MATVTVKQPTKPVHEKIKFLNEKNEKVQLAAKARLLLGYKGLFEYIAPPGALAQVLHDLEIEPLNRESVTKYKQEVLELERKRVSEISRKTTRSYYDRWAVSWHEVKLDGYKKPIPMYVLNKAVQIAEKMPTAEFSIEEMTVTKQRVYINPDPFLIVSYGDERYYVEVWDEPKFEARQK